jgi:isoleucyl-tRNA synthetase
MPQDKINAYMTLYTALVTISKAAAPMIPFMTEDIYRNLVTTVDKNAPISVHLCDFPEVLEEMIDTKLEEDMERVLDVVVMGRSCRNASNIKNRQPIGKMYVKAENELSDFYKEIIEDELNVKTVEFTDDVRAYSSYSFKPQLKTVGPKYGKLLGQIRQALTCIDGNNAMDELNAKGMLEFDFAGEKVELTKEDLLIEIAQTEGFESGSDNGITVVLDTNLTEELIEEGFMREIISKIQTMRKEADFEVMDKITVYAKDNAKIADLLSKNAEEVKNDVLATDIIFDDMQGYSKEWNINGENVVLGVKKN